MFIITFEEKITTGTTVGILIIVTIITLKNNKKEKVFTDDKDIIRESFHELKEARKTARQLTVDAYSALSIETIISSFDSAHDSCKRMDIACGLMKIELEFFDQYNTYMINEEYEKAEMFIENMILKMQIRDVKDYIRNMKSERLISTIFTNGIGNLLKGDK